MRIRLVFTLASLLLLNLLSGCAISEKPLSAAELFDLGEKYLIEMDYEQAVVYFTQLIEIEPMNPRGYTGLSESYIGLRKSEDDKSLC